MILVNTEAITKEIVDRWYEEWEVIREDIHNAHERRDGSAIQFMQQGIELYEGFLTTSSVTGDTAFSQENDYELMPINGMERLQFVKMRPGQYACYRQLDELFKETKKRCARLRVKKK